MNGMNVMLQDLIPKIERSYDHSEFTEDILVLAYIARKGVLDTGRGFYCFLGSPPKGITEQC